MLCINNSLSKLSNLPNKLILLYCDNNQLTELNNLPNTLTTLICNNDKLTKSNEQYFISNEELWTLSHQIKKVFKYKNIRIWLVVHGIRY